MEIKMPQDIHHYSIIEIFYQLGKKNGFVPIKEYALINILKKVTDERIDIVWINKEGEIEYAFEFETTKSNWKKARDKLMMIDNNIKKYVFFVKKSFNFENIDSLYTSDSNAINFLSILAMQGIQVKLLGEPI